MDLEKIKEQMEKYMRLPFPAFPDGFNLWAEFAALDADIVGEVQGIIGKAQDGISDLDYYKEEIKRIKKEAQEKKI